MGLGHALSENLPAQGGIPLSFKYAKLGVLRALLLSLVWGVVGLVFFIQLMETLGGLF